MSWLLNLLKSPELITSILVIIAALALWYVLHRVSNKYKSGKKSKGERATVIRVLIRVLKVALLGSVILVILQINGVNVTSMIAGLGIAGAIVGLALQDWLKDAIMGIHIISDRFFVIGECVEYCEQECIVLGFSLTTTKLKSLTDNSIITVCNRNISEIRRVENTLNINIPLPCDSDRTKIDRVLQDVCREAVKSDIIEGCEYKGLNKFESSAYVYLLAVTCKPAERNNVRRKMFRTLVDILNENGIYTPFEKIDVSIEKE